VLRPLNEGARGVAVDVSESGLRQIVVGMAEPWSRSGAEPKAGLGHG
jgi:hypothetical protein